MSQLILVQALNLYIERLIKMSSTTNPTVSALQQIADIFKNQLANLGNVEVQVLNAPVQNFLAFLKANPTAVNSPLTIMPQITVLQAQIIAAQTTGEASVITNIASSLSSAFNTWAAAAASVQPLTPPAA